MCHVAKIYHGLNSGEILSSRLYFVMMTVIMIVAFLTFKKRVKRELMAIMMINMGMKSARPPYPLFTRKNHKKSVPYN